jgi:predicted phage terminase large subunit-like protein
MGLLERVARIRRLQRLQEQLGWAEEVPELEAQPAADPPTEAPSTDEGVIQLPVDDSVVGLMRRLSPNLEEPTHLAPLLTELDAAIAPHPGKQVFFWFSVPPRHWKTFTLRHAIVKHLQRWPDEGVGYVSHTSTFARKQSRAIRKLAAKAGCRFSLEANRQDEWELLGQEGGLVARGKGGEITGRGLRLIILDDLLTREEANSQTERDNAWDYIEEDVIPRLTPDGAVFLVHTRWNLDDPIARAKKRSQWRGKNIPALGGSQENVALLPKHWPFEALAEKRKANPFMFASLYQGDPRPKGGNLFQEPARFDWETERPRTGYRVGYGADLAYTEAKLKARDWSVILRMLRVDDPKAPGDPKKAKFYIVHVVRKQVDAPAFTLTIKATHAEDPGPIRWYASGTEKGAGSFIKEKVPAFKVKPATTDKYVRATPFAEAWNEGRVLVPGGEDRPEWVDDCVDEITSFTGVNDANDDTVDAGAAAFDELNRSHDLTVGGARSDRW